MVTKRKPKQDPANDIPVLATDAKAFAVRSKKTQVWPRVDKGTHLTVYTYEDGTTRLEWDDAALLAEIRALDSVSATSKPAKKTSARRSK